MTDQEFLLPSATRAPGKTRDLGSEADPGYVPGVEYDQYGRYRLPAPDGDPAELTPWTRVTTLAGVVTNSEGLRIYTERKIARGIGLRADLRELLASEPEDKAVQDEVLDAAKAAAGVGSEARSGTARHSVLEHWSRTGELRVDESEPMGRDLLAAVRKLEAEQITVAGVERLVVNRHLGYAGRADALWSVTLPDGRTVLRIGDAKFGKEVTSPGKRHQIGVQLSLYVNATDIYDPATRTYTPMPAELDRSVGYVLHVHDGRAELHEVDLITGWQCAKTAALLHVQRRASVTFLPVGQPVTVADPELDRLRAEVALPPSDPTWGKSADIPDVTPAPADEPASIVAPTADPTPAEPERSASGRAKRACSKCRRPGHTAKRCPGGGPAAGQDDATVEQATPVTICPHAHGWTSRASDGAWVCVDCGRPSEATVAALRTGGPLPTSATAAATAVAPATENGAMVARLDPAPAAPAAPPWLAGAAPAQASLLQRIEAVRSLEELGALWDADQGTDEAPGPCEWSSEHTTAANRRAASGLPTVVQ